MKKQILNIGKILNNAEQKEVLGGRGGLTNVPSLCTGGRFNLCSSDSDCCDADVCAWQTFFHHPDGSWSSNSWGSTGWETAQRCTP